MAGCSSLRSHGYPTLIPHIKRPRFLFFLVEDTPSFDLLAFLRGELKVGNQPQIFALSPAAAAKHPVSAAEVALLAGLSAESWTAAASLGLPAARIEELARAGTVLCDVDESPFARLRRYDELLSSLQWHPYAAFYHFMTRESEERTAAVKRPETEVLAASVEADSDEFVQRFGPPPTPFHHVREPLRVLDLPVVEPSAGLYDVLRRRKTIRAFDTTTPLRQEDLNVLLRYVFGCHGYAQLSAEVLTLHKTSPSGGSLHPLEAYPVILDVEGVPPGLYHYDVGRHALELLQGLDQEQGRALAVAMCNGQSYTGSASVLIVLVARFFRNFWKYRHRSRAYSVVLMDAAHLSQTFYMVAAERGLGAFFTAVIDAPKIEEVLGLEAPEQGAVAICGCGNRTASGPDLGLDFKPFTPRQTDV